MHQQYFQRTAPSVSVVIPICNEHDNIEPLYHALVAALERVEHPFELLFVDDGSCDGSSDVLRRLVARDPRVRLLSFTRNFGQTAAMQAGLDHASGDYVVTIDGDLQNDPADIPTLLARLEEGYDLAHGWRRHRQDAMINRKLPSLVANWIIAKTTRFPVHDLGCTLKAMRAETARRLRLVGEMHRFIPILAHAQGARCVEVETRHHPRRHGQTKYGIGRTSRVVLDLITVNFLIRFMASPMKLFGKLGLLSLAGGLAAATAAGCSLLGWLAMNVGTLTVIATLLGVSGVHLIALGLVAELGARIYFDCQAKSTYEVRELVNFPHTTIELHSEQLRAA